MPSVLARTCRHPETRNLRNSPVQRTLRETKLSSSALVSLAVGSSFQSRPSIRCSICRPSEDRHLGVILASDLCRSNTWIASLERPLSPWDYHTSGLKPHRVRPCDQLQAVHPSNDRVRTWTSAGTIFPLRSPGAIPASGRSKYFLSKIPPFQPSDHHHVLNTLGWHSMESPQERSRRL